MAVQSAPTEPAIRVAGLTKRFGSVLAVDHISFDVGRGEILGLLGPNGAGKTTTMRMILGLVAPQAGDVFIAGYSITRDRERALDPVGTIIEEARFYPFLTGVENLRQVARLRGLPTDAAAVRSVLAKVGLEDAGTRRVRGYSLGMRQRLALALALLQAPRVLILDEPMNGLDPVAIKDLRDRLLAMRSEGVSIILSSHLLGEVEQLCDRVVLIDHGRLIGEDRLTGRDTDEVEVRVRLNARAADGAAVLGAMGVAPYVDGSELVVPLLQVDRVPEVVRQLVAANLDVYGVSVMRPSLEQRYLAMTGQDKGAAHGPASLEGAGA
jgi:ABC-2 type transport system ATP-binding protein